MRIGIFFGEHDFKVCRDESIQAVEWYRRHRFEVIAKKVGGLGHERKPEVAAALFADTIGVSPKTPPDLGPLVMMDVMPVDDARRRSRDMRAAPRATGRVLPATDESAAFSPAPTHEPSAPQAMTAGSGVLRPQAQAAPSNGSAEPARSAPRQNESAERPSNVPDLNKGAPRVPRRTRPPLVFAKREQVTYPPVPANLRLHGEPIGSSPMWVSLSVELPDDLKDGATVLWTDNGRPIPALNNFETQAVLKDPGDHDIEAHIITADDRKAVLRQTVTVLGVTTQPTP